MHIFVCHYTKLKDRKKHMENEIKKTRLGYSFIEKFDQEDLDKNIIERYFKNTENEWIMRTNFLNQKNGFKNLKSSEMSLILKHCMPFFLLVLIFPLLKNPSRLQIFLLHLHLIF